MLFYNAQSILPFLKLSECCVHYYNNNSVISFNKTVPLTVVWNNIKDVRFLISYVIILLMMSWSQNI